MSKETAQGKSKSGEAINDLKALSEDTGRKELFWLKGGRKELTVYKIPTKYLYFNIENGRYADKMIDLRANNPGVEIDPRQEKWKQDIMRMLMGEYPGTEGDKGPFEKLRSDILARQQLRPGVVLHDGGVLDGNRRLAVLLDLAAKEKINPTRFEFFDGVILPPDVGPEDRWRIEAGLQLGRDEKHQYSTINQLLKIREGLDVFRNSKKPEQEIAKTLYGIPEKEIEKDIRKVKLIDEYLMLIRKPRAYNEITRLELNERFEEAVNNLEVARKLQWPPNKIRDLKLAHFAAIRDKTMDNWDMRDIRLAMGSTGKGKSARLKNEKALNEFLDSAHGFKEIQNALASTTEKSPLAESNQQKADEFLQRMAATKKTDKPLSLATDASAKLEALLDTLKDSGITTHDNWKEIEAKLPSLLESIIKTASQCAERAKKLKVSRLVRIVRRKNVSDKSRKY